MASIQDRNEVHLDGTVTSCRMSQDGRSAELCVTTVHPRLRPAGDEKPIEYLRHKVLVDIPQGLEPFFRALSGFSKEGGITEMYPCTVNGRLFSDGRESYVVCPADGFSRSSSLKTDGNNSVRIDGTVESVSSSRSTAFIMFRSGDCVFNSVVPQHGSPEAFKTISSGRLKAGDRVSLSGALSSSTFTDGKRNVIMTLILPRTVSRLKVEETVKVGGPSI